MQKVGGYADLTMRLVLIPTTLRLPRPWSHWKKRQGLITGDVYQILEDGELMSLRQEDRALNCM